MTHDSSPDMRDPVDALRLLALSRIPRCGGCPRLGALRQAYQGRPCAALPPVPGRCTQQVCAPLVRRLISRAASAPVEATRPAPRIVVAR